MLNMVREQALVMSCREANEHLAAELMQLQAQRQQQLLSQCAPVQVRCQCYDML